MTASSSQDALFTASRRLLRYRIPLAIALVINCIVIARVPLREMLAFDAKPHDATRQQRITQRTTPSVASQPDASQASAALPVPEADGRPTGGAQSKAMPPSANRVETPYSPRIAATPLESSATDGEPLLSSNTNSAAKDSASYPLIEGPGLTASEQSDRVREPKTDGFPAMRDMVDGMGGLLRMHVSRFQKRISRQTASWTDHAVSVAANLAAWARQEVRHSTTPKRPQPLESRLQPKIERPHKAFVSRSKTARQHVDSADTPPKQTAAKQLKREYRWHVRNPAKNGGKVAFMVDGKIYSLAPGQSRSFSTKRKQTVRFHRGADFGTANQTIREGRFQFIVTETGWHLVPAR